MTDSPLRVGFGKSVLLEGRATNTIDGIGRYTEALSGQLSADPQLQLFDFAFNDIVRHEPQLPCGVGGFRSQAIQSVLLRQPFSKFSQTQLPVDLVHATDHYVPKTGDLPLVATLMDAIPLAHPEWITYRFKRVINALWRRTFGWADRIITISEFSKGEIAYWFDYPHERIRVVPLGVDPWWFEPPESRQTEGVNTLGVPANFFLFVGTLQPRKNLLRLIEAHALLTTDEQRAYPLVVVGRPGWACDEEVDRMTAAPETIKWLKRVDDQTLKLLMHRATAFVFPSLYEGFGLPVVEAFACGAPVLAADASCLPEVCGDAAMLFDPHKPGSIKAALESAIYNQTALKQLTERGLERARHYSWSATAAGTIGVYRELC